MLGNLFEIYTRNTVTSRRYPAITNKDNLCGFWLGVLDSQYSKTCVKQPLSKRPKIDLQDQLSLNAGQKYCRMLQGEHSAILSTFIKLPFVIKIFVLSIFEWLFYIYVLLYL